MLDGNPDPEKFEAMKVWAEKYDGMYDVLYVYVVLHHLTEHVRFYEQASLDMGTSVGDLLSIHMARPLSTSRMMCCEDVCWVE